MLSAGAAATGGTEDELIAREGKLGGDLNLVALGHWWTVTLGVGGKKADGARSPFARLAE